MKPTQVRNEREEERKRENECDKAREGNRGVT